VREVREETGLDVAVTALVGMFHNRAEYKDDHVVVFAARCDRPEALRSSEGMEIAETGWFALDALPELSPAAARRIAGWRDREDAWGIW
jgi:8-oxo-dGTP pyrophosphatase MutT (NUDIX family)